MKIDPKVFKAYDIRGAAPAAVSPGLAEAVGRALADWLQTSGPVAVGRDMRVESAELADHLIAGLVNQGREVWDIGLVTSDMIYFAVGHFGLAGGAMVTASHNPGQDDGIKLCREKALPMGIESGLQQIRDVIEADDYKAAEAGGRIVSKKIVEDWVEHVLSFVDVDRLRPYKLAVDAGNGMAGVVVPALEPRVPFDVTRMFFELDGSFPNHPANPMVAENLKSLAGKIVEDKLDLGLAFDGDGDRAFLVDETGSVLSGSVMARLLVRRVLKQSPGAAIVYDVRVSKLVPDTIKALGGVPVRSKVGHPFIVEAMQGSGAVLGVEATGHFYLKDNFYADGALIAAVMAIEVLSQSDLPVSRQVADHGGYFSGAEINLKASDFAGVEARLEEHFGDAEIDRLDGLTVDFGDWWFNLRSSNTEPTMRLNVEARSRDLLKQKTAEVLDIAQT